MRNFSILLTVLALSILALSGCKEKQSNNKTESTPAETSAVEQPAAVESDAKSGNDGCPGNVKLLKSITMGDDTRKLEYDATARVVNIIRYNEGKRIYTQTVVYDDDQVVAVNRSDDDSESISYSVSADGLYAETKGQHFLGVYNVQGGYLNRIGNESGEDNFHYHGGNLSKTTGKDNEYQSDYAIKYKYDNKKSPLSNSKSPKWFLQFFFSEFYFGLNNNIVEYEFNSGGEGDSHITFVFEYDSDGFPTKRTKTVDGDTETTTFTYCN
ncbi:MAG: hypothetical protein FWC15_08315 [Fibromonadales bacterium]|nr:hypothetical protein [Fibromonadales bacterium]